MIKMKMNNTSVNIKIVGICLIKNEDLFVERVLKNIINFCDEIIVLDNMSTDNTFEIVKRLTREYNKIKLFELEDPLKSHKFIEKYAITNTWVFGVDGDEIYDPAGLDRLRLEILLGKYQTKWQIMGNSLHCKEINLESKTAKGYLAPPSRPMTKLYNFSILKSWNEDCSQRLHGKNLIFKEGFDKSLKYNIYEKYNWDDSYFRCLHLCFINRSSFDPRNRNIIRLNPQQSSRKLSLVKNFICNLLNGRISFNINYKKLRYYGQGELVVKDIQPFFSKINEEVL